ncbi:hypothetical protein HNQ56_001203 [Anaerotaenia torta]|uniref:hypothetical protein n=1 Tax=Anaerotaenia torta TaxID=433293 RepID=UPI003D253CFE
MEKVKPETARDEIRALKINHVDYTEADINKELERREAKLRLFRMMILLKI